MDGIMLLTIFVSVAMSTIFMALYNKRAFKMIKAAFQEAAPNEFNDKPEEFKTIQARVTASTWFIMISGIVLMLGFLALYVIQLYSSWLPQPIEALVSSGLYMPIVLFLIGLSINQGYRIYIRISHNTSLSSTEMKKIIVLMAIILNITLIVIDWKLGLFVVAIILGKYIWIDFIFDRDLLISQIANVGNLFKDNGDISVEFLCLNYAKIFYPIFLVPTILYQLWFKYVPDISLKLCYIVLIYVSIIAIDASFFSGMDTVR